MAVTHLRTLFVAVCLTMATAASASAQVFGTFSWQMQPYCNIVTLTLTNNPAGFVVEGTDNQCGAPDKASAVGVAAFNASGLVNLNFTIVTAPSGKPVHVAAVVSPASGSGTWTDSVGNTGNFVFGSPGSGPPRPLPASGVGPATITTVELAPAAVGATQLAANAVTGASVADGSLAMADIANGPRAAFASGNQVVTLTSTDDVVRSVTITAPSAGTVLVNASGYVWGDTAAAFIARCSITTGTTVDFGHLIYIDASGGTNPSDAFGAVRGFNVPAGAFTVNLVCDEFSGSANVSDTSLTALFIAQ